MRFGWLWFITYILVYIYFPWILPGFISFILVAHTNTEMLQRNIVFPGSRVRMMIKWLYYVITHKKCRKRYELQKKESRNIKQTIGKFITALVFLFFTFSFWNSFLNSHIRMIFLCSLGKYAENCGDFLIVMEKMKCKWHNL